MTLNELIQRAYTEDLPNGDCTTDAIFKTPQLMRARLLAKEDLVLSGRDVFTQCLQNQCPGVEVHWHFINSNLILRDQTVATIAGDVAGLLRAERVALNFLGILSGIATFTHCFVKQVSHTRCQILDTRKTTPLLRELQKAAVRDGGGRNHRLNLSEAVLIKDNHIQGAGGLTQAVALCRQHDAKKHLTVECASLEQVREAVKVQVHRILLDNMSNDIIRSALDLIPSSIETEASGNMTVERVKSVAELGVQFISIGALTHSAPVADFSLLLQST